MVSYRINFLVKERFKETVPYFFITICFFLFLFFQTATFSYSYYVFYGAWANGTINISECNNIVENKNKIVWSNFSSSYCQICPKSANKTMDLYSETIARQFIKYLHLKDIYCNSKMLLETNNKQILVYQGQKVFKRHLMTEYYYEHIIFLYCEWGSVFAHFIHDCLPQLIEYPADLIKKSMIITPFNPNIAKQYFRILNISDKQILYNPRAFYYAKNLYMIYPSEPSNALYVHTFPKLIYYIRKYFGVDLVKGTRFVFTNRPVKNSRHINNLEALFNMSKIYIKNIPFEVDKWDVSNLRNLALRIATYRVWISPSGSNMINMIYMNKKYRCGVCLIQSAYIDLPNYICALSMQIWATGFSHSWEHHSHSVHNCNLTAGIISIQSIIYAVFNKKWPKNTFCNMKMVFDLKTIYEETFKNISEVKKIEIEKGTFVNVLHSEYVFKF